jgi:hypothetical protein
MKPKRDSDWLIEHFSAWFAWIERDGKTTRGKRPEFLDHPMHTAADMVQRMWLCKCKWENHENAKACEECGRLKP